MKKLYTVFTIVFLFLFTPNVFAQEAAVVWVLNSTTQLTSFSVGNLTGSAESISAGSGQFGMSVFDYSNDGQRLWEGTAGWISGTEEATRYIQFDSSPESGNSFVVSNVAFNYGAVGMDDIIKSNAYYSIDGWVTRTLLNTNPLAYPSSTMSLFTQEVHVTISSGTTFSVRIYPYAVVNSSPMRPTFAVHNSVGIRGTTTAKKNCTIQVTDAAGKWGKSVVLTAKLSEPGLTHNIILPNQEVKFYKISPGTREGDTVEVYINFGKTDTNGVASVMYTIPSDSVAYKFDPQPTDSVLNLIRVEFAGDANYNAQSGISKLTIVKHVTSLLVANKSGCIGQTVILEATLIDNDVSRKGVPNQELKFYKISPGTREGDTTKVYVGSDTTDANGVASISIDIKDYLVETTQLIVVEFLGDRNYSAQSDSGKLTITLVGIENSQMDIPTKFALLQNYPNPFNPETVINYQMPVSGKASLKVFDMLGREVATLVNEVQEAGTYEVSFNGKSFASGAYFYRFQSGDFVKINKMILMK